MHVVPDIPSATVVDAYNANSRGGMQAYYILATNVFHKVW